MHHTCDTSHVNVRQLDDLAGHDIPHGLRSVPSCLVSKWSGEGRSNSTRSGGLSNSTGCDSKSRGESGHFMILDDE